jgi:hypothetical protein
MRREIQAMTDSADSAIRAHLEQILDALRELDAFLSGGEAESFTEPHRQELQDARDRLSDLLATPGGADAEAVQDVMSDLAGVSRDVVIDLANSLILAMSQGDPPSKAERILQNIAAAVGILSGIFTMGQAMAPDSGKSSTEQGTSQVAPTPPENPGYQLGPSSDKLDPTTPNSDSNATRPDADLEGARLDKSRPLVEKMNRPSEQETD